ncbi:MAG TPA: hypothetical protein DCY13_18415 [Verrucomicrobiales bacterium]|nr:hypothetical protein [Verrucomicrobiales bacterium]
MKTSVAISLIFAGTALILTPPTVDHLQNQRLLETLSSPEARTISLREPMSANYAFGCWVVGTFAIGSAMLAFLRRPQADS